MPTRAVLLDFDGVIADTENVHVAAWERTFGALGLDVPPEVCARAAEEDDRAFLADVFAHAGIEGGNVEGWVRSKQNLAVMLLADAPRLYRGVPELVRRLAGRTRLAVVSTTWQENIDVVLRSAGLREAFEVVVGKEDVAATKPDPECYRLALARLRVKAADAAALEDSPTGLAAAQAAGLRTLAVGHRRPPGAWSEGAVFLPALDDAEAIVEALGLD